MLKLVSTALACTIVLAAPICAQSVDVIAGGLEVTQGVQDLNNSVRLVSKKRTFVRFYVRTAQDAATTTAILTARRGDSSVTLTPANEGGQIQVVSSPNRTVRDQAFLFELPDGYREGTVSLRAEVNPLTDTRTARSPEETDYTNNVSTVDVRFEDVPPLSLVIYSIAYKDQNGNRLINDERHVRMMLDWIERAWPINSLQFWIRNDDISNSIGGGLPTCTQVNSFLAAKRLEDMQNPSSAIPQNARYYGMVDDRGGFMRGCADGLPGFASSGPTGPSGTDDSYPWDTDGSYGDWYGSHEVAHNFMRYHAEFCGAQAGDVYPFAEGRIGPSLSGVDSVLGFDIRTRAVYGPDWKDNMTYCDFQWTGKFTYHGLMDALQQNVVPQAASARHSDSRAATDGGQDRLLVVGTIDPSKQPLAADVSPMFILNNAVEIQPRKPGDYAIVLKNAGQELANYPFTPVKMTSGPSHDPNAPELSFLAIQELVPYVQGTTRVEILGPGKALLYSVNAGAAFPTIQINTPAAGDTVSGDSVNVSWTAADADGDPMRFTVEYSADGGQNWETVEENLQAQSVTIDRGNISGSAKAMFRVLATDGIHTTAATSNAFTVAGRPPVVSIDSPGAGAAYVAGSTVTLAAYAYDSDSGEVAGQNIRWTSSIDGSLGQGAEIDTSTLSVGDHVVTVTVADDGGLPPATATVNIKVVSKASDLPAVADNLIVEPDNIILDPIKGLSADAFEVLNRNAAGPLSWTAAADKAWVTLNATTGTTPQLVGISLGDISSLNPGVQGATVTVTTANGQTAKVRVEVKIPAKN